MQNLSPETLALLRRHNLLQPLARAELLSETVKTVDLSSDQRDQIWNNFKSENKLDNTELFEAYLKNNGLKENDLRWQLELSTRARIYSQKHFQHKAEARFLARKEQLDKVVYSLLRLQDRYLARELYLRISEVKRILLILQPTTAKALKPKPKASLGLFP